MTVLSRVEWATRLTVGHGRRLLAASCDSACEAACDAAARASLLESEAPHEAVTCCNAYTVYKRRIHKCPTQILPSHLSIPPFARLLAHACSLTCEIMVNESCATEAITISYDSDTLTGSLNKLTNLDLNILRPSSTFDHGRSLLNSLHQTQHSNPPTPPDARKRTIHIPVDGVGNRK